jgi:hypothetical protein
MSSSMRIGSDVSPTQPTFGTTYLQYKSLGLEIVTDLINITEEEIEMLREEASSLLERFGPFFSKVLEFVEGVLKTHSLYDRVVYWVEQTFKAVQHIEKRPGTAPSTAPTTVEPSVVSRALQTWASVTAVQAKLLSEEETSLWQIKVQIEDKDKYKAL